MSTLQENPKPQDQMSNNNNKNKNKNKNKIAFQLMMSQVRAGQVLSLQSSQMSASVYLAVTLEYIVAEMVKLDDSTTKKKEQDDITAISWGFTTT